jgi:hypothetical protein
MQMLKNNKLQLPTWEICLIGVSASCSSDQRLAEASNPDHKVGWLPGAWQHRLPSGTKGV